MAGRTGVTFSHHSCRNMNLPNIIESDSFFVNSPCRCFFQKRLQDYNTSHQKQVKGAENRKRLDAVYSFCPLRNHAKRHAVRTCRSNGCLWSFPPGVCPGVRCPICLTKLRLRKYCHWTPGIRREGRRGCKGQLYRGMEKMLRQSLWQLTAAVGILDAISGPDQEWRATVY